MIDYEVDIFDMCAKELMARFDGVMVSSMNVAAPASFPAVSIIEADSRSDAAMADMSGNENASVVTYDVAAFSNLRKGAKAQAKEMWGVVDDVLMSLNFKRTYRSQGAYSSDESVYRVIASYTASIDANGKLSRR